MRIFPCPFHCASSTPLRIRNTALLPKLLPKKCLTLQAVVGEMQSIGCVGRRTGHSGLGSREQREIEKKERIVIQVRMVIKVIIDIVNSDNRYR